MGETTQSAKMLSQQAYRTASVVGRRNFGVAAVALQKVTDPIQALFLSKVQEYSKKSKAGGGNLVDSTPELEKALAQELGKVAKAYGGGDGVDMTKFPTFSFKEPVIDDQVTKS